MNLTTNNFRLYSWLFASIWTRHPIIISSPQINESNALLIDIANFFPQYRQTFSCSKLPKKIMMSRNKPHIMRPENISDLKDSVLNILEEEKNVNSVPFQFVCCDVLPEEFTGIFSQVDRGWLCTTRLPSQVLANFFPGRPFEKYELDDCEIIFLDGHPRKVPIESRLIKTFITRSPLAAGHLIQKKIAEIRYAAEILIDEIEQGRQFSQAEVQEYFELDDRDFEKCLEIIEAEFRIKIGRYVRRTSTKTKHIQNKIMKLEGIIYACCYKNNQLIGLTKSKEIETIPIQELLNLPDFIKKLVKTCALGTIDRLIVEMTRKTKLLIEVFNNPNSNENMIWGLFLKADIPVVPISRAINQIIKEEIA